MTAAARFFNLVRPPIIIIETGQFAEYTYTGSCVLYRGLYTRVILCFYRSRSSPEQLESISLCNFWPPRAHLHTEIGLYTHLHTHIYIYTHTQIGTLHWPTRDLPRENWPPHAIQYNAWTKYSHCCITITWWPCQLKTEAPSDGADFIYFQTNAKNSYFKHCFRCSRALYG